MKLKRGILVVGIGIAIILAIAFIQAVGLIESNQWEANLTTVMFSTVAFGDIDNDNDSDLILTGCYSDVSWNCENGVIAKVYINNGTNLNENSSWQQNLTGVGHGSTAWGDIDNDGYLDLIISGCTSATTSCNGNLIAKIYMNNGTSLNENTTWQQNLLGLG